MRLLLRLAAFVTAPWLAVGATSPLDAVVSLPEFKVFADRPLPPPEKWDYVKLGNFEILSNAPQHVTKRFVRDLSEFQTILSIVSPAMRIQSEQPVTVLLCAQGGHFQRFVAKPTIRSIRGLAASLFRDIEIASIVVDYESLNVTEELPFFAFGDGRNREPFSSNSPPLPMTWSSTREIHASEEFIRQYIHLSLSQINPRPPAWLAEGIATIYSNIEYTNKWIEIGLPKGFGSLYNVTPSSLPPPSLDASSDLITDPFGSGPSGLGYTYRAPFALMPMDRLFAVDYDSPLLGGRLNSDKAPLSQWSHQASAFVHLCLYGEKGKYRPAFQKFTTRLATEPPTEALFKECFGISYKDMVMVIRSYIDFTNYTNTIYKITSGDILNPPDTYEIRPATDAEIGRIKGETFRLAGQDEEARREFVVAYLRGERDPQLLASLGLMARQRRDDTRAHTYLEAVGATASRVPRPRAYLELSRLRSAELAAKSGPGPLGIDAISRLLDPLFTAQRLPQQLSLIYLEIAGVWERSAVRPTRDNLGALEHGIRLFPQNGELILRTAALLLRHGYANDASSLIQRALNVTRDPALKEKLEELRRQSDASPSARPGPSARFSPEANLGPELRQRLAEYRSSRSQALAELRARLASVETLAPAARETTLADFATLQTPRLRALERDAARLEADLGWPPDEGDDYTPLLAALSSGANASALDDLDLLLTALHHPQGLSPPQLGLIREMILEAHDGAAPRGAFLFFSPETARVRLPSSLPSDLAAQLDAFAREKDALKAELRRALAAPSGLGADLARALDLGALAERQNPRFAALEARAEDIRRAAARLPSRPSARATPTLPPALAARLAAYQEKRDELQRNSRRDLRALRDRLPSDGTELVASGDPPRLRLRLSTSTASPELRAAIDAFNLSYSDRATALNRELAELRRLIAATSQPGAASGKSVGHLLEDFATAALREASAATYRDCRAAALQAGLSPEQRRLLLGHAGERQPAVIVEF